MLEGLILEGWNGWVFRSFSKRLLIGPNIFSNMTLVCSHSCSQYIAFNIRECGSSFASMESSVSSFPWKRVKSEEVLMVSGSM